MHDDEQPAVRVLSLSRRDILRAAGVTGAGIALSHAFSLTAFASDKVRKSFTTLSIDEKNLLRDAIAVMRARPATDPTSWAWQANIHGTYDKEQTELDKICWNSCPHGSFNFFPWHRWYLYFMEQILADAVKEPKLTLLYWNYTALTSEALRLPPELIPATLPDGTPNAFYNARRFPYTIEGTNLSIDVGKGSPMLAKLINPCEALKIEVFCRASDGSNSFGSMEHPYDLPEAHALRGFGALESQPHNQVHDMVGGESASGETGDMGDINTAGNDPTFWLHHANIDRLWQVWLALEGRRSNPLQNEILKETSYNFVNAKGELTKAPATETFEIINFGYTYDTIAPPPYCDVYREPRNAPIANCLPEDSMLLLASALEAKPAMSHVQGRTTVSLASPTATPNSLKALGVDGAKATGSLKLVLEGVSTMMESTTIAVFIGLADGQEAKVESPNFVGVISIFGTRDSKMQVTFDRSFDISDELAELAKAGGLQGSALNVSLIGDTKAPVTVQRIYITP